MRGQKVKGNEEGVARSMTGAELVNGEGEGEGGEVVQEPEEDDHNMTRMLYIIHCSIKTRNPIPNTLCISINIMAVVLCLCDDHYLNAVGVSSDDHYQILLFAIF